MDVYDRIRILNLHRPGFVEQEFDQANFIRNIFSGFDCRCQKQFPLGNCINYTIPALVFPRCFFLEIILLV